MSDHEPMSDEDLAAIAADIDGVLACEDEWRMAKEILAARQELATVRRLEEFVKHRGAATAMGVDAETCSITLWFAGGSATHKSTTLTAAIVAALDEVE